jgi:hypothetical protein
MKRAVSAAGVLLSTLVLFSALVRVQPFDWVSALLDRAFGAAPKWTDVQDLYRDPQKQEVSRGEHPLESFATLAQFWGAHPGLPRVVFIGNSQMQSVTLAAGEAPYQEPAKTYVDLVGDRGLQEGKFLAYRLSAGGMSYEEALWYVYYLLSIPEIKPDAIMLQINYQFFAQSGLRDGMLELLQDARFRQQIETEANAGMPDSQGLQMLLARFRSINERAAPATDGEQAASSVSIAGALENRVRDGLEKLPEFSQSWKGKESFLQMLYRIRLYILRVSPGSSRSITGPRLLQSRASVENIARMCRESNVQLMLYHAPLNPNVKLYSSPSDKEKHYAFVRDLAARYQLPVGEFEESIPSQDWGKLLNGPEVLHLGRAGHKELADLIFDMLAKNLGRK